MTTMRNFLDSCQIEDAQDEEAREIHTVIHESIGSFSSDFYFDKSAFPELQRPSTSAYARGGKAIVTYFDDRIIGFGFIRKSFASYIVDHLYVSAVHQGKGVGGAMLAVLIDFVIEQNVNTDASLDEEPICIEIWVDNKLSHAIDFLEKMGFVKSGEQRRRLKKLPHLSDDERDASSVEVCLLLLLKINDEEDL